MMQHAVSLAIRVLTVSVSCNCSECEAEMGDSGNTLTNQMLHQMGRRWAGMRREWRRHGRARRGQSAKDREHSIRVGAVLEGDSRPK